MGGTVDLTRGRIPGVMLRFAWPLMLGNLLQQGYNVADTLIVGRVLGADALAAVGSSSALIIFLTSVFIGLSMGAGALFSIRFGAGDLPGMRRAVRAAAWLAGIPAAAVTLLSLGLLDGIIAWLRVPGPLEGAVREYLAVVLWGMLPVAVFNHYATLLRAVGNSRVPLLFLGLATVLNIGLDLFFVFGTEAGVRGVAWATVLAQTLAASALWAYVHRRFPELRLRAADGKPQAADWRGVASYALLTALQQTVMNFGILLVQGLVNSFGAAVMAAFAAAVRIDSFAYMPVQDFGNAFSTFIAQHYGAGDRDRIRRGIRSAAVCVTLFAGVVSAVVFLLSAPLMRLFVSSAEPEIVEIGARYLRIEGAFYVLIGYLFLFYGLFRAVGKPGASLVLTVVSLGTRVALAYTLSALPSVGYPGIWWSVPAGWLLADGLGWLWWRRVSLGSGQPSGRKSG